MSAKSGSLSIACVQLGPRKLSVIRSSGVSAIQGLLNGRAVGTFRIVCYIVGVHYSGVSVNRGSPVSPKCSDSAFFQTTNRDTKHHLVTHNLCIPEIIKIMHAKHALDMLV